MHHCTSQRDQIATGQVARAGSASDRRGTLRAAVPVSAVGDWRRELRATVPVSGAPGLRHQAERSKHRAGTVCKRRGAFGSEAGAQPPWEMTDPPKDIGHLDHGGIFDNATPDTRGMGGCKKERRALGVTRRSGAPPAADGRRRHDTIPVDVLKSRSLPSHRSECTP